MKLRCGQSAPNLPANAQTFTAPSGRLCYLSGIDAEANMAIICYIDTGEFIRINYQEYLRNRK